MSLGAWGCSCLCLSCLTPTPACSAPLKTRGRAEPPGVCSPHPAQRPLLGGSRLRPLKAHRALWSPPRASLPGIHAAASTPGH